MEGKRGIYLYSISWKAMIEKKGTVKGQQGIETGGNMGNSNRTEGRSPMKKLVVHWDGLPRKAVEMPPGQVRDTQWDEALNNLM